MKTYFYLSCILLLLLILDSKYISKANDIDESIWDYLEGKLKISKGMYLCFYSTFKNFNFYLGDEETYDSSSDDLDSVRPKRKLFRWDNNEIPFEITIDSRRHYSNVMKIIEDINVNLEGCIKFRFVQTTILDKKKF